MRFKVGQEVVCVDAGPAANGRPLHLVLDRVYTVSGIDERWMRNAAYGIFLAEVAEIEDADHYSSYHPRRFRPATKPKRETDIGVFTEMLRTQKVYS